MTIPGTVDAAMQEHLERLYPRYGWNVYFEYSSQEFIISVYLKPLVQPARPQPYYMMVRRHITLFELEQAQSAYSILTHVEKMIQELENGRPEV